MSQQKRAGARRESTRPANLVSFPTAATSVSLEPISSLGEVPSVWWLWSPSAQTRTMILWPLELVKKKSEKVEAIFLSAAFILLTIFFWKSENPLCPPPLIYYLSSDSFICSLNQQTFIKCLLYARHSNGCRGPCGTASLCLQVCHSRRISLTSPFSSSQFSQMTFPKEAFSFDPFPFSCMSSPPITLIPTHCKTPLSPTPV